nr:hypothetical protein [Deltaproteobacteria bacterium]
MRTSRSLRWSLLTASSMLLAACSDDVAVSPADAAVSAATADVPSDTAAFSDALDVASDLSPVDAASKDAPRRAPLQPLAITDDCLLRGRPTSSRDPIRRPPPGGASTSRRTCSRSPRAASTSTSRPFNRADGAPSTAPILVHFGELVAPEFLADYTQTARSLEAASAIALFDLTHMRRVPFLAEMDANRIAGATDRAALIIRPLEPLPFGARVVVAIRRAVRTPGGTPLRPSPGFVALRDRTPSTDPRIEAARPDYETLFSFLATQGYARDDLHLAFSYTVASERHVLGPIVAMRSEVIRRAGIAGQIPFTIERVQDAPNSNVARIVTGTFTPPGWLDARNTITFAADGTPEIQPMSPSYPFTMVIPARAMRERRPLPLVIFGHGVFGTGRDYLTGDIARVIHPLAEQAGAVVVATDWIGLSGGDRDLIIRDVVTNINRINLVTDRLLQSLANNLALEEIAVGALSADPRVRFEGSTLIDPTRVYYYGVSLGGIQGSSFVSVSRRVSRAVLAVPGASWSNLLPRSIVLRAHPQLRRPHLPRPFGAGGVHLAAPAPLRPRRPGQRHPALPRAPRPVVLAHRAAAGGRRRLPRPQHHHRHPRASLRHPAHHPRRRDPLRAEHRHLALHRERHDAVRHHPEPHALHPALEQHRPSDGQQRALGPGVPAQRRAAGGDLPGVRAHRAELHRELRPGLRSEHWSQVRQSLAGWGSARWRVTPGNNTMAAPGIGPGLRTAVSRRTPSRPSAARSDGPRVTQTPRQRGLLRDPSDVRPEPRADARGGHRVIAWGDAPTRGTPACKRVAPLVTNAQD